MLDKQTLLLIVALEVVVMLHLNYTFALFIRERIGTVDGLSTLCDRHNIWYHLENINTNNEILLSPLCMWRNGDLCRLYNLPKAQSWNQVMFNSKVVLLQLQSIVSHKFRGNPPSLKKKWLE